MEHSHGHDHDSCTPDLDRDLVVTGIRSPEEIPNNTVASDETASPSRVVAPVIEVTPLSLEPEVIARSSQVPVVVLIGSTIDPGMTALRRDLADHATSAELRWILGILDADRFPQIVTSFRPAALPSVVVVAGGTGVGTWTTADGAEVDCADWAEQVVATVAGRLSGLPQDAVTDEAEQVSVSTSLAEDSRLQQAAELVGQGDAGVAVDLYDQMLAEYTDPAAAATLHRARAAVAVLARTRGMDRSAVLSAVADARRGLQGAQGDADTVLRAADVLVLLDKPAEAVDLLSGSLAQTVNRDAVRLHLLDMLHLLEPDDPVVTQARQRIATAVF